MGATDSQTAGHIVSNVLEFPARQDAGAEALVRLFVERVAGMRSPDRKSAAHALLVACAADPTEGRREALLNALFPNRLSVVEG